MELLGLFINDVMQMLWGYIQPFIILNMLNGPLGEQNNTIHIVHLIQSKMNQNNC